MSGWLWQKGSRGESAQPAQPALSAEQAPPNFETTSDIPNELPPVATPSAIVLPFSTILVVTAFGVGFLSGMMNGARNTALVYLAENAHRRPETVQGWYFYNKTKYYRMILGGMRRGSRTGLTMVGWIGGWCLLDVLAEDARAYVAEKEEQSQSPRWTPVLQRMGHWSDGALAGVATGIVGSIACKFTILCSTNMQINYPHRRFHACLYWAHWRVAQQVRCATFDSI